jgi:MraZ protein
LDCQANQGFFSIKFDKHPKKTIDAHEIPWYTIREGRKMKMSVFLSKFNNKIDKKGRVSVPASFRSILSSSEFSGVVLYKSFTLPAIEGCSMARMTALSNGVDQFDLFSNDHEDLSATLFADAHMTAFDTDGRILMPGDLQNFANLTDQALFVGAGPIFRIWHPDAFGTYQAQAKERLSQKGLTLPLTPKETP